MLAEGQGTPPVSLAGTPPRTRRSRSHSGDDDDAPRASEAVEELELIALSSEQPAVLPPASSMAPLEQGSSDDDDGEEEEEASPRESEAYEILSQDDLPRTPPRAHAAKSTVSLYREMWL